MANQGQTFPFESNQLLCKPAGSAVRLLPEAVATKDGQEFLVETDGRFERGYIGTGVESRTR